MVKRLGILDVGMSGIGGGVGVGVGVVRCDILVE